MKPATLIAPVLLTAALLGSIVSANIALPQIEMHTVLAHEEVDIRISGDQGVVTGTFQFENKAEDYYDLTFYLPVYGAEGVVPAKEMVPKISLGGKELEVVLVIQELQADRQVDGFGKLPQLEGQRVWWFMIPHVPQQPEQKKLTLKIEYTQKLANGKFIYTPLIPRTEKDKDYGSITVSADRPLTLQDADQHQFQKDGDKFVVEPADKRAIVVAVGAPASKLP